MEAGRQYARPLFWASVERQPSLASRLLYGLCKVKAELRAVGLDGVLLLGIGAKGQYSLEQTAGGRLCLFSPLSGPRYYEYDRENAWFANKQDGACSHSLAAYTALS